MNTRQFLETVYETDKSDGSFIIATQIETYSDIFNYLDPAPPRRRDLDQDFLNYIVECANDIPLKYKIRFQIMLPEELRDTSIEERVKKGIRTYFAHWKLLEQNKIRTAYWRSLIYFLTGFAILFFIYIFDLQEGSGYLSRIATEGMFVGGWVFLWEGLAELAFKSRDLRKVYRIIRRSARARIDFVNTAKTILN